jgi:hypothetical protein
MRSQHIKGISQKNPTKEYQTKLTDSFFGNNRSKDKPHNEKEVLVNKKETGNKINTHTEDKTKPV